ncbi:hypothetical protein F2P56_014360, partial [Juglans regia]
MSIIDNNLNPEGNFEFCYNKSIIQSNGLWRAENALTSSLPIFVAQLAFIILINRIAVLLLKPLGQPRITAEILGGIIMGHSGLGHMEVFRNFVLPIKSLWTLETVANLSLVYYMFLVGLETDISLILHAGKKAYSMALAGIIVAMSAGFGLFYKLNPKPSYPGGAIFWAIGLACTNFPDLARILADAKLLRLEMGQTALTSALINDFCCWVFLVVAVAFLEMGVYISVASTLAFTLFCVIVVRPALKWIMCRITKEDDYEEYHIGFILLGVILFGFIADACGAHSIAGAFMLGVIMPKGELKDTLMEKVEDFVSGTMLPLFFLVIGIRVNISTLAYGTTWMNVLTVMVLACVPKILSTWLVSLFYKMPPLEGLALGLLMNTKGLLSLIILSAGRDRKALDNQTFSVMVVAFWFMTFVIGPILASSYRQTWRSGQSGARTIQSAKPDSEFRILVGVHAMPNVSSIVNLIQASNPTELSPICVFAVHLVELTGRASAMLIVHDSCTKSSHEKVGVGRARAQSDVLGAFESLESRSNGISVKPLTAVSAYDSMHEDICNLAEDKNVILILIPFHKQSTIDGEWEDTNPALRGINQNVLTNAPCSVGIFVDRGLSSVSLTRRDFEHSCQGQRFAMLYIGGPDDREALAYAWRMSGHPGVSLDVVRFVSAEDNLNQRDQNHQGDHYDDKEGILGDTNGHNDNREKQPDEEYLAHIRQASACNPSVSYMEKVVNNGEETLKALSTMKNEYDLYIVGRGEGMVSPLTSGLAEWSDCPELGALGDTLVSSSFASNASVLIIKQHASCSYGGTEDIYINDMDGGSTHDREAGRNNKLALELQHLSWGDISLNSIAGGRGQVLNEEVLHHDHSIQDVMIEDLQRQAESFVDLLHEVEWIYYSEEEEFEDGHSSIGWNSIPIYDTYPDEDNLMDE